MYSFISFLDSWTMQQQLELIVLRKLPPTKFADPCVSGEKAMSVQEGTF